MTGTDLKKGRLILGFSLTEMAQKLKTTRRSYMRWESGQHAVPGPVEVAVTFILKEAE